MSVHTPRSSVAPLRKPVTLRGARNLLPRVTTIRCTAVDFTRKHDDAHDFEGRAFALSWLGVIVEVSLLRRVAA